jgi:hypothetical protein
MQDRSRQFDEIFLQRTAGPYIWVNRFTSTLCRSLPVFPDQRTSPDRPDWSGLCQERKLGCLLECSCPSLGIPSVLTGAIVKAP